MREIVVTEHEAGQRLDRYVRKLLPALPRTALFKLLRLGAIRVDGRKAAGDMRLLPAMRVQLRLGADDLAPLDDDGAAPTGAAPAAPLPRELEPRAVHRDEHVLVVDKPAGLAVHGGSGITHSVVDWLAAQPFGVRTATFTPAPAHRLDRGTAGLLVVGLTPVALRTLAQAFRDGGVRKVYHAVVHGVPVAASGSIDAPLHDVPRAEARAPKVVVAAHGQPARTDYARLHAARGLALLRVVPLQGRQHQIRAHLAHVGHPIVGDRRYGSRADTGRGFMLHASELQFVHPVARTPVHVVQPRPAAFDALLARD